MLFHISQQRFETILSQGYALDVPKADSYAMGDNVYHLLPADHGTCNQCKAEFDSLPVESALELEIAKAILIPQAPMLTTAELRDMITLFSN